MLLTLAAFCIIDGAPSVSSTYFGSSTTSPTASIRQRHCLQQAFDNIITMIRPPCDSTDHDMQELHLVPSHATYKDYDVKENLRLESLP
jgi:hypothetical protein